MSFGLCNAPATFEQLMDRVLCGMRWSHCLVYLDDVISFGKTVPEALLRLEEVLARMSDFGLQLKAKKCTFMQTEVAFLGHIVGRTGLACDPEKLSAVRNWHEPNRVKAVRQFVGFVGYYPRFVKNFTELADPLVSLTRKGVPFVWGSEQQRAFDALKACLLSAPILGFPTEEDRFVLDTDASLFAIGGVLSQIQNEEEVVIAYASRSLRISQRRYCTTRREMLAAVVMCTHFRLYLRGSQFTLRTDHRVPSGGYKSLKTRTGCWPTGTYCWANSQLHSSTDRDLYILMLMECLGSVVSVGARTARFPRPICRRSRLTHSRC